MLTDTHCHLNFESFDSDRKEILERARSVGIMRILNPGIDLETSRAAVELAASEPDVYAAVGVHPNDAGGLKPGWLAELRQLAQHERVVAIGEIGLDDYWDRTPLDLQRRVLQDQLELAAELDLPVVIHCRDKAPPEGPAIRMLLEILGAWQARLQAGGAKLAYRPGVLHSFSGSLAAALQAASANFCIGISGPVTYKNAGVLREVVGGVPEMALLSETDAPFLSPHPHRGKRNEPAYVRHVVEKITEIRREEPEAWAQVLAKNAERLFRWVG